MAKINQFGGVAGISTGDTRGCLPFEAMLVDAIDGILSAADQQLFDEHLKTCEGCRAMLADAERGVSWMKTLRADAPEPPAELVTRILAATTGVRQREMEAARLEQRAAKEAASLLGRPMPIAEVPATGAGDAGGRVLPFRTRLGARVQAARLTVLQTRFAMTAAMAFFSIALTLNLTGVRLNEFRASDLRPANVRRGLYATEARMVRYYANLRVVYELESRVRDLQHADNDGTASQPRPEAKPEPAAPATPPTDGGTEPKPAAAKPKANSGTSRYERPAGERSVMADVTRRHAMPVVAVATPVSLRHAVVARRGEGSI